MKANRKDNARRGTVLIIVVGILAILMLLGSTLALLSRLELKTSENYLNDEAMDILVAGVRNYCIHVLQEDKYGNNGYPYDYEKLDDAYQTYQSEPNWFWSPGDTYPTTTTATHRAYQSAALEYVLNSDDESFDSYLTEEWLPSPAGYTVNEPWRLFNKFDAAGNYARLFDDSPPYGIIDDSDGAYAVWLDVSESEFLGRDYGALLGRGLTGKFALLFFDLGGRRIDINATGNVQGGSHSQNQGLTPFESSLTAVIHILHTGGNAIQLIEERYGENDLPGAVGSENPFIKDTTDNDNDGTANETGETDLLDNRAMGTIDPVYPANSPIEFRPEDPWDDDRPFGPLDLQDLFWYWGGTRRSRAAGLLGSALGVAENAPAPNLRYFTTTSGTTIVAGRSTRAGAWDNTTYTNLFDGFFFPTASVPESATATDAAGDPVRLPLMRPLIGGNQTVNGIPSAQAAENLRDLIMKLGPVARVYVYTGGTPPWTWKDVEDIEDGALEVVVTQTATNIVDMIDTDNAVTKWYDASTERFYYGVEVTPYVAEVEAAIDTDDGSRFLPEPADGAVTGIRPPRGGKVYYRDDDGGDTRETGEPVWIDSGSVNYKYDADDVLIYGAPLVGDDGKEMVSSCENFPPTGWGKYIKLVNPWNTDIDLSNYRLVLPHEDGDGNKLLRKWKWKNDEANGAHMGKWVSASHDSPIEIDLSGTIVARGHFVVLDDSSAFSGLSEGEWQAKREINYMQEAAGGDVSPALDDFENLTLRRPSVVQLWQKVPERMVMEFNVVESTLNPSVAEDEDDNDNLDEPNYSAQIKDPRPCYLRMGALQNHPWAMVDHDSTGLGNIAENSKSSPWGPPSTQAKWFNTNWRDASTAGDGWSLFTNNGAPKPSEDNLLHSFPPAAADSGVSYTATSQQTRIMNIGKLPTVGALGFVHAGIPWCTVSLSEPPAEGGFGESSAMVCLRNLADYIIAPYSPYEDGLDNDGDGEIDQADTGGQGGPEIRRIGRVNVNNAPVEVLRGVLKQLIFTHFGTADYNAATIAQAIVNERANGPYSSLSDFFQRVPLIFGYDGGNVLPGIGNTFRREALARFMSNLITVRTDVWGVTGRAQIGIDMDADGALNDDEVLADRRFYFVIDRSHDPARIIVQRYLPDKLSQADPSGPPDAP